MLLYITPSENLPKPKQHKEPVLFLTQGGSLMMLEDKLTLQNKQGDTLLLEGTL